MPDDTQARPAHTTDPQHAAHPQPGPLLTLLRERTAAQHRAVEGAMDLASFAQRERYADVLAALHGFHAGFEAMLAACALPPELASRPRTAWIEDDLAAMGVDRATIAALPRCTFAMPPRTAADAVGCLYVTEGATLGGQVIRKALTRMHADDPVPMRYFTSHGADTARRWREFCAIAESVAADDAARERAATHAVRTFDVFGAWLTAMRPRPA